MGKINFAEQFKQNWCPCRINNSSGLNLIVYVPLTPGIHEIITHT